MIITNVNIVDAHRCIQGNIHIEQGIIKGINVIDFPNNENIIDGKGYTLMPSFVDMHCHLREPGYEYKEDMQSGMTAALKGGYTHIAAMANTRPIVDNLMMVENNLHKAEELELCDLTQVSAVTKDFEDELVDFQSIVGKTPIFSNDGVTIFSKKIMREVLAQSSKYNFIVATHCDPETEIAQRDLEILKSTGGNLHICHVSKKKTVELIKKAKENGMNLTCEITPHHIFSHDVEYKVNPPFGTSKDWVALIDAIKNNVINICATDHAPHSKEDKQKGSPGISNIEVAFPMVWSVFYEQQISINKLSEMMSLTPSKMLGLNGGDITVGKEANLVLVDLEYRDKISTKNFISRSNNNPFNNKEIRGKILITIKRGEIKYDNR